ncbi:MAG: RNA polymerase sigma factor [Pseudobdellovibrio sp.]
MKLYQNGDEGAFKALYIRHSSKIFGFLKSRIRSEQKVKEVYQEVFIKIHKSKHLYNDKLPALPWIFTITKTVMIDELRKEKALQLVSEEELDKLEDSEKTEESENLSRAGEMLAHLPEMQKAAIEMRYLNEQTFEQIAESLKVSPGNARQIISRGVKRLRELLGEGGVK